MRRIKLKQSFFLALIVLLILGLSACGSNKTDNDQAKTEPKDIRNNLKSYEGQWVDTGFQMIQLEGYEAPFGTELMITVLEGQTAEIRIYDISSPPANRIASVETTIEFNEEGEGIFSFDDDGWGNVGKGTIKLKDGQVSVIIESKPGDSQNPPDMQIFSGEKTFIRKQ